MEVRKGLLRYGTSLGICGAFWIHCLGMGPSVPPWSRAHQLSLPKADRQWLNLRVHQPNYGAHNNLADRIIDSEHEV